MLSIAVSNMPKLDNSVLYLLKNSITTEVSKIKEMGIKHHDISVSFLPHKAEFSEEPIVVYVDGNFDRWLDGKKIREDIKERVHILLSQVLRTRQISVGDINFLVRWRDKYGYTCQKFNISTP